MTHDIKVLQSALNARGFGPLKVDGIYGPKTKAALVAFKAYVGLAHNDELDPVAWARLTSEASEIRKRIGDQEDPPWIRHMLEMLGRHESEPELAAWLASDGQTVGDPKEIPWCGDAVATALNLAFGRHVEMPKNPYAAINWLNWGIPVNPQRGAILVFWRESPKSWKGHVGFYMGESETDFYVLGGNQRNTVSIAPIAKTRLRPDGSRWPPGAVKPNGRRVFMSGGTRTTNEE